MIVRALVCITQVNQDDGETFKIHIKIIVPAVTAKGGYMYNLRYTHKDLGMDHCPIAIRAGVPTARAQQLEICGTVADDEFWAKCGHIYSKHADITRGAGAAFSVCRTLNAMFQLMFGPMLPQVERSSGKT